MLFLCTAILGCAFLLPSANKSAISASAAGAIGEIYLGNGKTTVAEDDMVFDGDQLKLLYQQLTGDSSANFKTVKALADAGNLTAADMQNGEINLTFAGKAWQPVYLSKSGDDVILTLLGRFTLSGYWKQAMTPNMTLVANGCMVSPYHIHNNYSTSVFRVYTMNAGGTYCVGSYSSGSYQYKGHSTGNQSSSSTLARFTMGSVTDNVLDFLVKPSQVDWQMSESSYIGDPKFPGGTGSSYIAPAPTNEWINDFVWLPSVTEVRNGLWQTSLYDGNYYITRSGGATDKTYVGAGVSSLKGNQYVTVLTTANQGSLVGIDSSYWGSNQVSGAPALHLNLTKAAEHAVQFVNVADIETQYTGSALTVADAPAELTSWCEDYKVTLTYLDGEMLEVGKYKAKAELTEEFIGDAGQFRGEPDWDAGESETVRFFYFTITKRKLKVNISVGEDGVPSGVEFEDESLIADRDTGEKRPQVRLHYVSTDDWGYDDFTAPSEAGTYRATAELVTEVDSYEIDVSEIYYVDFEIEKVKVDIPILGLDEKEYTGEEQSFLLLKVSDLMTVSPQTEGIKFEDGELKATAVGEYKIVLELNDDGRSTEWTDGTVEDLEICVTITPRLLTCTIDMPASWQIDQRNVEAKITVDGLEGDIIQLDVYYQLGADTFPMTGADGVYKMPELGADEYDLYVKLAEASPANNNGNYTMSTKTKHFTVTGIAATFTESDLIWVFNNANYMFGADQVVEGDYSQAALILEYTGAPYIFYIDDAALASKGVKIDTESGTEGYSGDTSATDCKDGIYTVTVYITAYSKNYNFPTTEYRIRYKINKAKYDLSGVKWNYSEGSRVFNSAQQSVELVNLPEGLTITSAGYSGNKGTAVQSYTAQVVLLTSADTNNYVTPVPGDPSTYIYDGEFPWTLEWSIDKATLKVEWNNNNKVTDAAGETYFLPVPVSDAEKLNVYYYLQAAYNPLTGVQTDPSTGQPYAPLTKDDIVVDKGKEVVYWVVAELKESYANNYALGGSVYDTFIVGKDRIAVTVSFKTDNVTYNGQPQATLEELEVQTGGLLGKDKFGLKWYKDSQSAQNELSSAPVDAGNYIVVVYILEESAEQYYIDNDYVYNFVIEKAKLDISSLYWEYSHGNGSAVYDAVSGKWLDSNGTEVQPFVYDGSAHVISVGGSVPGVSVTVTGNYSEINAGNNYTANAEFDYNDVNYELSGFASTLVWSVDRAHVNADDMRWNYTQPFTYTRDENGAVSFTVELENVPEGLKDKVVYGGVYSESNAGEYTATCSFASLSAEELKNYYPFTIPADFPATLVWNIEARYLAAPVYNGANKVFANEEYDLVEMCGVSADFGYYCDISVTYYKDSGAVAGFSGTNALGAGRYSVAFTIKDGLNSANNTNVYLDGKTRPAYAEVTVEKLTLTVTGWNANDEDTTAVLSNSGVNAGIYNYRILNAELNPVTKQDVWNSSYTTFYVELCVEANCTDDVIVEYAAGVPERFEFVTGGMGGFVQEVAKPVLRQTSLEYNGEAQDFGLAGFNENLMELRVDGVAVDISVFTQTNVGKYSAVVRLKDGVSAVWENSGGDRTSITLNFEITVKYLTKPTVSEKFVYNGSAFNALEKLENYLPALMEVAGDYSATDAGSYSFTVSLKDTQNYAWASGAASPVKQTMKFATATVAAQEVSVNWQISKFALTPAMWTEGGVPTLTLPGGYSKLVELEYSYLDEYGVEIAPEELVEGTAYTVVARLKSGYEKNFEFVNEQGEITVDSKVSAPHSFEFGAAVLPPADEADDGNVESGASNSGIVSNAVNFIKHNWLWFVIALAVLLFLILLIVILAKRRKKNEEVKEERKVVKAAKAEAEAEAAEEKALEKQRAAELKAHEDELAKAKAQAEIDVQKAQAEAEIAKIKAEAEAAKVKAEAEAEAAKLKSAQTAAAVSAGTAGIAATAPQQSAQTPVQPQQFAQAPAPAQQAPATAFVPVTGTAPAQPELSRTLAEIKSADEVARAKAEAEAAKAKAEVEIAKIRAEAEIAKAKAEVEARNAAIQAQQQIYQQPQMPAPQYWQQPAMQGGYANQHMPSPYEMSALTEAKVAQALAEARAAAAEAKSVNAMPSQQGQNNSLAEIKLLLDEISKVRSETLTAHNAPAQSTSMQDVKALLEEISKARAEAEVAKAKAEAQAIKAQAEAEIRATRAQIRQANGAPAINVSNGGAAELLGDALVSAIRKLVAPQQANNVQQPPEDKRIGNLFDVDGFYDKYDDKKSQ